MINKNGLLIFKTQLTFLESLKKIFFFDALLISCFKESFGGAIKLNRGPLNEINKVNLRK